MKKLTTILLAGSLFGGAVSLLAQPITLPVNLASSGRIMSSNGPAHLGGGNISGVINPNDTGDFIVGDNGGNSFNFSLIVAFDTSAAFRSAVAGGAPVTLSGSTLSALSTGNVSWAPISASVNAIGSTADAPYGDANNFRRHAAFNLTDGTGAVNYAVAGPLAFAGDPYTANTTFTVDMTSVFAGLPLSGTDSRVMIGISAWTSDLSAVMSADGIADRVAFVGSSLELTAVPEPSTYAAIFGLMALGLMALRRRQRS
jgi:hypothetical protein